MPLPAIPASIHRVRLRYGRILSHLDLASRASDSPLSENQIWQLMARTASPSWAQAYAHLQRAQQHLNFLDNNDNKPLGAIGMALESEETCAAETNYLAAQSRFTMLDEKLRRKKFLGMLLEDIVAREKSIEVSMGISDSILQLKLDQPAPTSETTQPPLGVRFGVWARRMTTAISKAPSAPSF